MAKVKVVHILTDTNIGGAGVWLERALRQLGDDFEVTVLLPPRADIHDSIAAIPGVAVREVAHIADQSFSMAGTVALYKHLKKIKPQVVHTHASLSGRMAAKLCSGTFIVNSRHCVEPVNKGLKKWLKNLANTHLSHRIIAVSHGVYDNLIASGVPKEKVVLIANGVDVTMFDEAPDKEGAKASYGVEDALTIGYVGRLAEVKGPLFLADILLEVQARTDRKVVMLIAGQGPLEGALREAMSKRQLSGHVQYLGYVKDTGSLYRAMDVCVNTSRSEAISLTLLEAMAAGVPVMAFDVDGLDQVIKEGENGHRIKPFDTKAYGQKLAELLAAEERREAMAAYGHRFVGGTYNITTMIRRLERLYKERNNDEDY